MSLLAYILKRKRLYALDKTILLGSVMECFQLRVNLEVNMNGKLQIKQPPWLFITDWT